MTSFLRFAEKVLGPLTSGLTNDFAKTVLGGSAHTFAPQRFMYGTRPKAGSI